MLWKQHGLPPLWWHKALELPLALYFYHLFRVFLHRHRYRAFLAAVPVVMVYLLLDVYFMLVGRVFRLSEFGELPELLDILPWLVSAAIALVVLAPLVWVFRHLRWPSGLSGWIALLPLTLLILLVAFRPTWFLRGFTSVAHNAVVWSDYESVKINGRIAMLLYQAAKREEALQSVSRYRDEADYKASFEKTLKQLGAGSNTHRNVHLLLLEGFVDPGRFKSIHFNRDPVHPDFRKLLVNGVGNLSQSPVYGGYTAQAEFEILCGVPALQQFGTIEFNNFSGGPVYCMPNILAQLGYHTMATQGFKPSFFNSRAALKGIGFQEVYYPHEYAPADNTYVSTGDVETEQYLFDEKLLQQNLAFVRERLQKGEKPLLNYVLTIYGHIPFVMDEKLRPRVISVDDTQEISADLLTVANQVYYRSKAIADYIKGLIQIDPDAIIVMLADHLPPMPGGIGEYEKAGYLTGVDNGRKHTLLAVFDRGQPLDIKGMHHYDVPALIYRLLTGNHYCETDDCKSRSKERLQREYRRIMAHAVEETGE